MPEPHHQPRLEDGFLTRRDFLGRCGMGFGMLGLANLLGPEIVTSRLLAEEVRSNNPLAPRSPHFPGKAKRIIHIFANGGPSHVDTFDPKPALTKFHGQPLPVENLKTERRTGAAFQSPFKFQKYGKSGIEVSELFPHVAKSIDDIAVIRSMHADVPNHEPSLLLMNCGEARLPRPSMGSWVTYGLGSVNQNLPGFIALCPGGYPIQESQNWQSAFMPGTYQGTYINTANEEVGKMIEHIKSKSATLDEQRQQIDLFRKLSEQHARRRAADERFEARVQSFELAYRMQMDATDAFDISREPESMRKMYGDGPHARQTLIARRLVERGVRFVQIWHGDAQPWDNHEDLEKGHRDLARESDQPIGALLTDLKQRGMLEDTLVIWGGEFGRTPTVELPKTGTTAGPGGRDHNHHGFSMWLAGGGVRGGCVHGATDEFGYKAVEKPVHVHDLHATILHLLGFDHTKLTFRHAGRDFRLTDVYGNVVQELIV